MKNFNSINFSDKIFDEEIIENLEFDDCTFENCKFSSCTIVDCIFTECSFKDCTFIDIKTKNVNVLFAEFVACNLIGVKWHELQKGSVSFPIGKLEECLLKYNQFDRLNFKRFNFYKSSIINSTFARCDLSESVFKDCELKQTDFIECDIRKADFRGAKGYNIDIMNNITKGAKFSYPEVVSLLKYFNIVIEK